MFAPLGAPDFARVQILIAVDRLQCRRLHAAEECREPFICAFAHRDACLRLVGVMGGVDLGAKAIDHVANRISDDLSRNDVHRAALAHRRGARDFRAVTTRRTRDRFPAPVRVLVPEGDLANPEPLVEARGTGGLVRD